MASGDQKNTMEIPQGTLHISINGGDVQGQMVGHLIFDQDSSFIADLLEMADRTIPGPVPIGQSEEIVEPAVPQRFTPYRQPLAGYQNPGRAESLSAGRDTSPYHHQLEYQGYGSSANNPYFRPAGGCDCCNYNSDVGATSSDPYAYQTDLEHGPESCMMTPRHTPQEQQRPLLIRTIDGKERMAAGGEMCRGISLKKRALSEHPSSPIRLGVGKEPNSCQSTPEKKEPDPSMERLSAGYNAWYPSGTYPYYCGYGNTSSAPCGSCPPAYTRQIQPIEERLDLGAHSENMRGMVYNTQSNLNNLRCHLGCNATENVNYVFDTDTRTLALVDHCEQHNVNTADRVFLQQRTRATLPCREMPIEEESEPPPACPPPPCPQCWGWGCCCCCPPPATKTSAPKSSAFTCPTDLCGKVITTQAFSRDKKEQKVDQTPAGVAEVRESEEDNFRRTVMPAKRRPVSGSSSLNRTLQFASGQEDIEGEELYSNHKRHQSFGRSTGSGHSFERRVIDERDLKRRSGCPVQLPLPYFGVRSCDMYPISYGYDVFGEQDSSNDWDTKVPKEELYLHRMQLYNVEQTGAGFSITNDDQKEFKRNSRPLKLEGDIAAINPNEIELLTSGDIEQERPERSCVGNTRADIEVLRHSKERGAAKACCGAFDVNQNELREDRRILFGPRGNAETSVIDDTRPRPPNVMSPYVGTGNADIATEYRLREVNTNKSGSIEVMEREVKHDHAHSTIWGAGSFSVKGDEVVMPEGERLSSGAEKFQNVICESAKTPATAPELKPPVICRGAKDCSGLAEGSCSSGLPSSKMPSVSQWDVKDLLLSFQGSNKNKISKEASDPCKNMLENVNQPAVQNSALNGLPMLDERSNFIDRLPLDSSTRHQVRSKELTYSSQGKQTGNCLNHNVCSSIGFNDKSPVTVNPNLPASSGRRNCSRQCVGPSEEHEHHNVHTLPPTPVPCSCCEYCHSDCATPCKGSPSKLQGCQLKRCPAGWMRHSLSVPQCHPNFSQLRRIPYSQIPPTRRDHTCCGYVPYSAAYYEGSDGLTAVEESKHPRKREYLTAGSDDLPRSRQILSAGSIRQDDSSLLNPHFGQQNADIQQPHTDEVVEEPKLLLSITDNEHFSESFDVQQIGGYDFQDQPPNSLNQTDQIPSGFDYQDHAIPTTELNSPNYHFIIAGNIDSELGSPFQQHAEDRTEVQVPTTVYSKTKIEHNIEDLNLQLLGASDSQEQHIILESNSAPGDGKDPITGTLWTSIARDEEMLTIPSDSHVFCLPHESREQHDIHAGSQRPLSPEDSLDLPKFDSLEPVMIPEGALSSDIHLALRKGSKPHIILQGDAELVNVTKPNNISSDKSSSSKKSISIHKSKENGKQSKEEDLSRLLEQQLPVVEAAPAKSSSSDTLITAVNSRCRSCGQIHTPFCKPSHATIPSESRIKESVKCGVNDAALKLTQSKEQPQYPCRSPCLAPGRSPCLSPCRSPPCNAAPGCTAKVCQAAKSLFADLDENSQPKSDAPSDISAPCSLGGSTDVVSSEKANSTNMRAGMDEGSYSNSVCCWCGRELQEIQCISNLSTECDECASASCMFPPLYNPLNAEQIYENQNLCYSDNALQGCVSGSLDNPMYMSGYEDVRLSDSSGRRKERLRAGADKPLKGKGGSSNERASSEREHRATSDAKYDPQTRKMRLTAGYDSSSMVIHPTDTSVNRAYVWAGDTTEQNNGTAWNEQTGDESQLGNIPGDVASSLNFAGLDSDKQNKLEELLTAWQMFNAQENPDGPAPDIDELLHLLENATANQSEHVTSDISLPKLQLPLDIGDDDKDRQGEVPQRNSRQGGSSDARTAYSDSKLENSKSSIKPSVTSFSEGNISNSETFLVGDDVNLMEGVLKVTCDRIVEDVNESTDDDRPNTAREVSKSSGIPLSARSSNLSVQSEGIPRNRLRRKRGIAAELSNNIDHVINPHCAPSSVNLAAHSSNPAKLRERIVGGKDVIHTLTRKTSNTSERFLSPREAIVDSSLKASQCSLNSSFSNMLSYLSPRGGAMTVSGSTPRSFRSDNAHSECLVYSVPKIDLDDPDFQQSAADRLAADASNPYYREPVLTDKSPRDLLTSLVAGQDCCPRPAASPCPCPCPCAPCYSPTPCYPRPPSPYDGNATCAFAMEKKKSKECNNMSISDHLAKMIKSHISEVQKMREMTETMLREKFVSPMCPPLYEPGYDSSKQVHSVPGKVLLEYGPRARTKCLHLYLNDPNSYADCVPDPQDKIRQKIIQGVLEFIGDNSEWLKLNVAKDVADNSKERTVNIEVSGVFKPSKMRDRRDAYMTITGMEIKPLIAPGGKSAVPAKVDEAAGEEES